MDMGWYIPTLASPVKSWRTCDAHENTQRAYIIDRRSMTLFSQGTGEISILLTGLITLLKTGRSRDPLLGFVRHMTSCWGFIRHVTLCEFYPRHH